MHGVGHEFSIEAFKSFNLKPFIPVVEQVQPDPEFPTVKFPNPEGFLLFKRFNNIGKINK